MNNQTMHNAVKPNKLYSTYSFIVPIYNDADLAADFCAEFEMVFQSYLGIEAIASQVQLIFVNDGSEDKTLNKLLKRQKGDSRIKIIDLSRNFGKEAALTAGLKYAKGNVTIPLDIDLQDPPEIIFKMIDKWKNGAEIVVGRRVDRASDSFFKRLSADIFYYLFNKNIPEVECLKMDMAQNKVK
jgi:glycosyltransferase involved in cell wall biosynthesis